MGNMSFFEKLIANRIADMHCAYIGKVISTDGETATVQPLGLARSSSVVSNVPIACKKLTTKTLHYTDGDGGKNSQTVAVNSRIAKGDLVVCLCADNDITEARRGNNERPTAGNHRITDSIIVGILLGSFNEEEEGGDSEDEEVTFTEITAEEIEAMFDLYSGGVTEE